MHPLWGKLLPAVLYLGSGFPALKLQPPALLSLTQRPQLALVASPRPSLWSPTLLNGARSRPVLRLSNTVELTGGRLMNSVGAALLFSLRPGLSLGVGPSVATFDLPVGRVRAIEAFVTLRFEF